MRHPLLLSGLDRRAVFVASGGRTAFAGAIHSPGSLRPTRHDAAGADLKLQAGDRDTDGGSIDVGVITKTQPKTKKPRLYKVLLLNDDYTPMEFVVYVLERYFNKSTEEATQIMLHVHHKGVGVCGVYTYEVAETKVTQVMDFARKNQHPLQCTMEQE